MITRRCCGIKEIVEGKLSSISVKLSVSSCNVAALRVTVQEIIDLVSRKHIISNGSESHVGYSFFKHYVIALLLQGNIELLDSPDSTAIQHNLALQVIFSIRAPALLLTLPFQVAQAATAPVLAAHASCFLLEVRFSHGCGRYLFCAGSHPVSAL
jgi:hypothetical protein